MKTIRTELYADKRKLLIYNIVVLLLSYAAWLGFAFFNPVLYDPTGAFFLIAIFYMMYANRTWSLLKQSPHLKVYDDGIEFDNLGFWKWEGIGGVFDGDQQNFRLICKGRDVPKKSKKTSACSYIYDGDTDIVFVGYKFPMSVTNIPPKEFYKTLYRYAPQKQKTKSGSLAKKITWRTLFWGVENPSAKRVLVVILSFIFIGLCFYAMFTRGFFLSDNWKAIIKPLTWVATIAGTSAYYWAYSKGKLKLKSGQKKMSPLVLVLVPFLIFLLLWTSVSIGIGRAYTELYGMETEKIITVNKKKHEDHDENCLESEDLGTGYMQELCIQRKHYKNISNGSSLKVYGKGSWFGFVFKKYRLIHE